MGAACAAATGISLYSIVNTLVHEFADDPNKLAQKETVPEPPLFSNATLEYYPELADAVNKGKYTLVIRTDLEHCLPCRIGEADHLKLKEHYKNSDRVNVVILYDMLSDYPGVESLENDLGGIGGVPSYIILKPGGQIMTLDMGLPPEPFEFYEGIMDKLSNP